MLNFHPHIYTGVVLTTTSYYREYTYKHISMIRLYLITTYQYWCEEEPVWCEFADPGNYLHDFQRRLSRNFDYAGQRPALSSQESILHISPTRLFRVTAHISGERNKLSLTGGSNVNRIAFFLTEFVRNIDIY